MLQAFWAVHNPGAPAYSRQYASLVLAHDPRQRALAQASRDRLEVVLRRPILTRIEPLKHFYPAEDYHQKYRLRSTPALMREFRAFFAKEDGFVDSTAAARVNGYLTGMGSCAQLRAEIEEFGLSEPARSILLSRCGN